MNGLKQGCTLQGGKYRIESVLGQGSFGISYLATTRVKMQTAISGSLGRLVQDQEVEIKVCIKEFFMKKVNNRGEDGSSVEGTSNTLYTNYRKRFRKEAENLSRLDHKNIVKVLEVFDENGTTYYVMQFVEGETLDDYIKRQRQGHLEDDDAKRVILEVAQALQYMHQKRMLHLDMKPNNIMRGTDGTEYIIDFGLSKQYDEKGEPESSTAIGLGTPGYAPTEQADYIPNGSFPSTIDIYALGATLYKMLTGKTPPSANEVLNNGLPARPAHVTSSMWNVVEHAMQPRRKDRPQNIAEFLALLDTDSLNTIQATPENDDETEVSVEPEPVPHPSPASAPVPPAPKPTDRDILNQSLSSPSSNTEKEKSFLNSDYIFMTLAFILYESFFFLGLYILNINYIHEPLFVYITMVVCLTKYIPKMLLKRKSLQSNKLLLDFEVATTYIHIIQGSICFLTVFCIIVSFFTWLTELTDTDSRSLWEIITSWA